MDPVTLYHNPRCSKSRQTLALLAENNIDADIIEYLDTPPSTDELKSIVSKLGVTVRDLIRSGEDAYVELNLSDTSLKDEQLLEAINQRPILMQRPIVVKGQTARIGRPPERVLEIL